MSKNDRKLSSICDGLISYSKAASQAGRHARAAHLLAGCVHVARAAGDKSITPRIITAVEDQLAVLAALCAPVDAADHAERAATHAVLRSIAALARSDDHPSGIWTG